MCYQVRLAQGIQLAPRPAIGIPDLSTVFSLVRANSFLTNTRQSQFP